LGVKNLAILAQIDTQKLQMSDTLRIFEEFVGAKNYELSNHLGNVLATISDKTIFNTDHYNGIVYSAQLYYPFGWEIPTLSFAAKKYRFGFNGKEDDREWHAQDYGFRLYTPRESRFISVDPITAQYPELTPYQFASNTPIAAVDLDGLEASKATNRQPANPKLGLNAVDNVGTITPTESEYKTYYQSKNFVLPKQPNINSFDVVADNKRKAEIAKAKQDLKMSRNPLVLLSMLTAEGFWTVYDAGHAAYYTYQGEYGTAAIYATSFALPITISHMAPTPLARDYTRTINAAHGKTPDLVGNMGLGMDGQALAWKAVPKSNAISPQNMTMQDLGEMASEFLGVQTSQLSGIRNNGNSKPFPQSLSEVENMVFPGTDPRRQIRISRHNNEVKMNMEILPPGSPHTFTDLNKMNKSRESFEKGVSTSADTKANYHITITPK
jgi:RHS repeat-associated protein